MPMPSQRTNIASILSLRTGLMGIVDLIKTPIGALDKSSHDLVSPARRLTIEETFQL